MDLGLGIRDSIDTSNETYLIGINLLYVFREFHFLLRLHSDSRSTVCLFNVHLWIVSGLVSSFSPFLLAVTLLRILVAQTPELI